MRVCNMYINKSKGFTQSYYNITAYSELYFELKSITLITPLVYTYDILTWGSCIGLNNKAA